MMNGTTLEVGKLVECTFAPNKNARLSSPTDAPPPRSTARLDNTPQACPLQRACNSATCLYPDGISSLPALQGRGLGKDPKHPGCPSVSGEQEGGGGWGHLHLVGEVLVHHPAGHDAPQDVGQRAAEAEVPCGSGALGGDGRWRSWGEVRGWLARGTLPFAGCWLPPPLRSAWFAGGPGGGSFEKVLKKTLKLKCVEVLRNFKIFGKNTQPQK